jgi:hypothetical protein
MRPWRVSLAGLMLVVVAVAAGLAVMIRPSAIAATVVYGMTFLSLGVALGGVIVSRGRRRAAWGGYLVFAGAYFVLCFAPWFRDEIEPRLPLSESLDVFYLDWMSYRPTTPGETVYNPKVWGGIGVEGIYEPDLQWPGKKNASPGTFRITLSGGEVVEDCLPRDLRSCTRSTFRQLAHSLGVLIFGLIGAVGGSIIGGRERRATPAPAIGVDPPIEASL